jgi:hypothetical protein
LVLRLPYCIVILHARSGGAGKMFSDSRHSWHVVGATNKWRKLESRNAESGLPAAAVLWLRAKRAPSTTPK